MAGARGRTVARAPGRATAWPVLVASPPPAGSRPAPRVRPRAAPRSARACPSDALQLVARAAAARGPARVLAVALGPREDLDRGADRGELHRRAGQRRRPLDRRAAAAPCRPGWRPAAAPRGASRSGRAPWSRRGRRRRPARRRRSPCARRRGRRPARRCAARRATAPARARRARPRRRRRGRAGAAATPAAAVAPIAASTVASWKGRRACGQRALDERDDGDRLAEAHHAAHAGRSRPTPPRTRGLGPEATRDRAVVARARPRPSASGRARAGRCAAPCRRGAACRRLRHRAAPWSTSR